MNGRALARARLLITAIGCGQSSTPNTTAPTSNCTFGLSTGATINGYPTGGTFASAVTTTPATGCDWTAMSSASWIHITSSASGNGNGSFTFSVDSNPGPARAGTLTAANEIVVFNQSPASGQ